MKTQLGLVDASQLFSACRCNIWHQVSQEKQARGASTLSSKFWLRECPDSRGVRPTHINTLQSNVADIEELHRDRKVGGQLAA